MSSSSSSSPLSHEYGAAAGTGTGAFHPQLHEPAHLAPEAVASLPPPGLSGPSQCVFAPESSRYLAFVNVQTILRNASTSSSSSGRAHHHHHYHHPLFAPLTTGTVDGKKFRLNSISTTNTASTTSATPVTTTSSERVLMCLDLERIPDRTFAPLLRWGQTGAPHRHTHKRRIPEENSYITTTATISNSTASTSSTSTAGTNTTSSPATAATTTATTTEQLSLEERLRRERQRMSTGGSSVTQFSWTWHKNGHLRLLVPARGSLHIQDGVLDQLSPEMPMARCLYDKTIGGGSAIDPQLSPDGMFVAWTCEGELFVKAADALVEEPAIQLSFGAKQTEEVTISHGVADFVAQEEMDRYRGFWWHPDSTGILFTRTDESQVPLYRIMHQDGDALDLHYSAITAAMISSSDDKSKTTKAYEDHRYPFAGKENPRVKLGFILLDRKSILESIRLKERRSDDSMQCLSAQEIASEKWESCTWVDPPQEAPEYLARVYWLPDGTACALWQNRSQNVLCLYRIDVKKGTGRTLALERSDTWINLHHMFKVVSRPIHADDCGGGGLELNIPSLPHPLPLGSFSFIFASERSGYSHLHLYTYVPGYNGDQAIFLKAITAGEWMVESIVGVDINKDVIYCTGTYDSPLERHLYAVPFVRSRLPDEQALGGDQDISLNPNGVRRGLSKVMHALKGNRITSQERTAAQMIRPVRLTVESGMHNVIMDDHCRYFVDTSSDTNRPTSVKVYQLPQEGPHFSNSNGNSNNEKARLLLTLYDAMSDDRSLTSIVTTVGGNLTTTERLLKAIPPPEFLSFPTLDGSETLYAALYRPDPSRHGPGPYPLVCAVYGGPHVQRVNRSWAQSADLRVQRLCSLGFCVVKCDNRGSSRRGMSFESAVSRRLGRLEVLDQVAVVRQLVSRGIADSLRVGIYGWSYGGYLSAMCLFRAPDVFHVAVAGAPVTSWDGYDTHYTERYMGLPSENPAGYRESAVFDHVPNMRGKLMLVHGLIDENVHFRHTARLINKLIAAGKDYDLLIFPEERHSPRRLRDRIYMEQRITEYFVRHLISSHHPTALDILTSIGSSGMRTMAGHL